MQDINQETYETIREEFNRRPKVGTKHLMESVVDKFPLVTGALSEHAYHWASDLDDTKPVADNVLVTVVLLKCLIADNPECKDADYESVANIIYNISQAPSEYEVIEKMLNALIQKYPVLMNVIDSNYAGFEQQDKSDEYKTVRDRGFVFNIIALSAIDASNKQEYSINPGILDAINQIGTTGN